MTLWNRRLVGGGVLGLALAGWLAGRSPASAQSTWDGGGGDNNWGTGANWLDNQVPSFPTDLTFAGTVRTAPNNNLTNVSVRNIAFDASAGAFTIGGNALTLGDEATADYRDGGIDQLDDSLQTINNNITLSRGQHDIVTIMGGGGLTLNGTISRHVGAGVRFVPQTAAPIKTTLTNTNGLIGGWATVQNPNPAFAVETYLYAKVDGSGNVVPYLDYTAATNIDGFSGETTLPAVDATTNIRWFGGPTAAESLQLAAGTTDLNTFLYEGPQSYLARVNIGDGNTLRFSDGGGFFRSNPDGISNDIGLGFTAGTITAGHASSPATLHIWKNSTVTPGMSPDGEDDNNTVNLNGSVIADNPNGGAVTVVSTGSGGVRTENAAHTFTGGLYINRGVWRAQGAAGATPFGLGDVHVASGAQAYVNNGPITIPNDFYLNGRGIDEAAFFVGAMRVAADSAILDGDIILTGDTRIGNRGAQATNADFGTPTQGVVFNGRITGDFDLELSIKNDQGTAGLDANMPTMILSNTTNDWGGDTTIGNGRIRVGGTGEVIPHGPGKGNLTLLGEGTAAARPTVLTLDGHTETVNGLFATGAISEVFVTNQVAGDATLRVGANNATSTFGGVIQDDVGKVHVTKIEGGTFTMTGLNAYTGDTRVEGGSLSVNAPNFANAADLYINTGATVNLDFSGIDTIDSLFFNGVGQSITGTWGSMASAADNKSNFFTGSGLLQLTTFDPGVIPGDFDGDGDVDGDDLNDPVEGWKTRFGVDLNGNDFLVWQRNLGTPAVAVAGAVPEPGTLVLAGLALLVLVGAKRQRG